MEIVRIRIMDVRMLSVVVFLLIQRISLLSTILMLRKKLPEIMKVIVMRASVLKTWMKKINVFLKKQSIE